MLGPTTKEVDCPYAECPKDGLAVVPRNVEILESTVEGEKTRPDADGSVYGYCEDHRFYVYFRGERPEAGGAR